MSPVDTTAQLAEVPRGRLARHVEPHPHIDGPSSFEGIVRFDSAQVETVLAGAGTLANILARTGAQRIAVSVGGIQWEVEAPAVTQAGTPVTREPLPEKESEPVGHQVTAPLVGVFYQAPGPGKPPFVEVGSAVVAGQQVAIVEAMKMLNEVVADRAGVIGAVLVGDGDVVEYGQPLFRIDPV